MNDIFSFKRYALLMKRQWVENRKLYLLGIPSVLGILTFFMCSLENREEVFLSDFGSFTFIAAGMFFILILSGTFFQRVNTKENGMFFFSLPTSKLEKWAVAFSYTMVIFPLIYLGLFYTVNFFVIQALNSIYHIHFHMLSPAQIGLDWAIILFLLTSFAVLGSLFLGKNGVFISFLVFVFLAVVLPIIIQYLFAPANTTQMYLGMLVDDTTGNTLTLSRSLIVYQFKYLLIPLCWILLYLKIKEKEV